MTRLTQSNHVTVTVLKKTPMPNINSANAFVKFRKETMSLLLLCSLIAFQSKIIIADDETANISGSTQEVKFTDSYIPAGMQVLSHYVEQLEQLDHDGGKSVEDGRSYKGTVNSGKDSWYDRAKGSSPDKPHKESETKMKSLVTVLNREAKRQDLGKVQGFSDDIINELEKTSEMSSKEQLQFILEKISKGTIKRQDVRPKINALMKDLDDKDSEINKDLEQVEPLKYLGL